MPFESQQRELRREVKAQLDTTVVGIELTLISIIQGLALAVLAMSAVTPLVELHWQVWPYIATGLLAILIFWSRWWLTPCRSAAGRSSSATPSSISRQRSSNPWR